MGRTLLYLVSFVGLAAYALESPLARLFAVMFANTTVSIGYAVDWSAPIASVGYQGIRTTSFSLSLLSSR